MSRPLHTSCFGEVHLLREMSIWDLPDVAQEAPYEPSSGSMSPDLGDTWRQGMSMSPQWEGDVILDSDDNSENTAEDECDDWSNEELECGAEGEARDYFSEVRKTSSRAPLCDCLTPADVLVLRTAGPQVVRREIVWIICRIMVLMKKKGTDVSPPVPLPEWPNLQRFVFGLFEPGRLPDLTAFEDSGERT